MDDYDVDPYDLSLLISLQVFGKSNFCKNKYFVDPQGRKIVFVNFTTPSHEIPRGTLHVYNKSDLKGYIENIEDGIVCPQKIDDIGKYSKLKLRGIDCLVHIEHVKLWHEYLIDGKSECFSAGIVFRGKTQLPYTFLID